MGLISYAANLAAALTGKAAPSPYATGGNYAGAFDGWASAVDWFRKGRAPTPRELIAENVNTAYACGTLNANLVASQSLRLYVTTSRGESKPKVSARGETREVSRGRLKHLQSIPELRTKLAAAREVEEVLDHPAMDLLRNPNPDSADGVGMSHYNLMEYTQLYQEVVGRAYWFIPTDGLGGTPSAIWILAAHQVREILDPSTGQIIDRYEFGAGGTSLQRYRPDQIVPFRCVDLAQPYIGGVSPMRAVFEKHRLMRKVDARTNALLDNGGMPAQLFVPKSGPDGNWSDETMSKRLQARLKQMFRFAGQGGIMVAEIDGQLTPLQWPTRDLADFEQMKIAKIDVANSYGVPITLLEPNDSNLTGVDAANKYHARYAGLPRLRRLEAALNRFYLPKWGTDRLFFAYDSPVPEDVAADRENAKVLVAAKSIRRDELRDRMGLDPVGGEDGEEWVGPSKGAADADEEDPGEEEPKPKKPKTGKGLSAHRRDKAADLWRELST